MDRKRCMVGGQSSIEAFALDVGPNPALAEQCWPEEVKGSRGVLRARRLTSRMPQCRSGDELVRAVIEQNAATEASR